MAKLNGYFSVHISIYHSLLSKLLIILSFFKCLLCSPDYCDSTSVGFHPTRSLYVGFTQFCPPFLLFSFHFTLSLHDLIHSYGWGQQLFNFYLSPDHSVFTPDSHIQLIVHTMVPLGCLIDISNLTHPNLKS